MRGGENCRNGIRAEAWRRMMVAFGIGLLLWVSEARGGERSTLREALSPGQVEERIQRYRTALVTLVVRDDAGRPWADREVVVEQEGHKFLFGCNAFRVDVADGSAGQAEYQKRFVALLNFATLPFYWGSYEPERGAPREERLRLMAEWCRAEGLVVKGHPLCWHQLTPRWARELSIEEVEKLQMERIEREVRVFAGLIDTWDVLNEAIIMPEYTQDENPITALCREKGRVEMIQEAFRTARRANPGAGLILNDYDTTEKFERLIEESLEAGVRMDAIGIQSHMHGGYRGGEWAWETCERFGRFGKPLHFTETTIISGRVRSDIRWHGPRHDDWPTTDEGEQLQAEQVEEFYRVLFSHPAVEAITWWDFSDHAWLGAPAGLVRKDMSPKPAYERLMALIKDEWWTEGQTLRTDEEGRVVFRGFLGRYSVGSGENRAEFSVDEPGERMVRVVLRGAREQGEH